MAENKINQTELNEEQLDEVNGGLELWCHTSDYEKLHGQNSQDS